jgi:hypothetical protein
LYRHSGCIVIPAKAGIQVGAIIIGIIEAGIISIGFPGSGHALFMDLLSLPPYRFMQHCLKLENWIRT